MFETFYALKTDFEKIQDSVYISIEGGGSRTGLFAIRDKTADLGLSSFAFDLSQVLDPRHDVKERVVAYDGIVVIRNQNNHSLLHIVPWIKDL